MLISIITATLNSAETLEDCLKSVTRQTYLNREYLVIDGGSSDETINIIKKYSKEINIFISEKDSGIYDALNKGILLSKGDIIGFLHADDLYASNDVLAKISKGFLDPSVCAIYGDLIYVQRNNLNKVIRRWQGKIFKKENLAFGWMPAHPTLYVRREWYQKIGGFDSTYRISADYLSILKMFSQPSFKAIYLPYVLVKMRIGGISNNSIRNIIKKFREDWTALRSCNFNFLESVFAIVLKNLCKLKQFF